MMLDLTVGDAGSGADRIVAGTAEDEINQALADVGAAGGGTVTLLDGTYSVGSNINITQSNITLQGEGSDKTIIQALAGYPPNLGVIVQAYGVSNFAIKDLTVDGLTNSAAADAIVTTQCTNGTISGCQVNIAQGHEYGIWIVESTHVDVLNNYVDGGPKGAGTLDPLTAPPQEGIETWSSGDMTISGNTITNMGFSGINLGSIPTAQVGDIIGSNSNIQVLNNTVDNAGYGIHVGVAGPREFSGIEIARNSLTNIKGLGIYINSIDGMTGAPSNEFASAEHPQSLHNVTVSNNFIDLSSLHWSGYGYGIYLANQSTPGLVSFSNIDAVGNSITDPPTGALTEVNFDHFTLDGNTIIGAGHVAGSIYNDSLMVEGSGPGVMSGGLGNDTYYVDNSSDSIVENTGAGTDTVFASCSYTLPANVETLSLATGTGIYAWGNSGDNALYGNSQDNVFVGGGGNDVMIGGLGNDTYYIDSSSDSIIESVGGGRDTVFASCSYTLPANVETLSLATGTGIWATGNSGDNALYGNSLNNGLMGGGGKDVMIGGLGNDAYYVDSPDDVVVESLNEGNDTVFASCNYVLPANVESLSLATGNGLTATGNSTGNGIYGNSLNNVIDGGGGNDVLSGGGGNDTFVFDTTPNASTNMDYMVDFTPGADRIELAHTIFSALPTGALADAAFSHAPGEKTAQTGADHIIYNDTTGALYYDPDGTSAAAAVQFAMLTTHPAITNADFLVV
jgi:hypothetical protein